MTTIERKYAMTKHPERHGWLLLHNSGKTLLWLRLYEWSDGDGGVVEADEEGWGVWTMPYKDGASLGDSWWDADMSFMNGPFTTRREAMAWALERDL